MTRQLSTREQIRRSVRGSKEVPGYWKSPFEQIRRLQVRQRKDEQIKGQPRVRVVYPERSITPSKRRAKRRMKALTPIGVRRAEWKGRRAG